MLIQPMSRRMMPNSMTGDQAFTLWKLCTTLDKQDLAAQALLLTTKGDILRFSSSGLHDLRASDVDRLVSIFGHIPAVVAHPCLDAVEDTSAKVSECGRQALRLRLAEYERR